LKGAAAAWVNPLTVCGLLDYIKKNGVKSVIMTAASSQLAKQFYKLVSKDGIQIINIVRKDEQVASLKKDLGAVHVLNQETESFMGDIKALIGELKPTVIIECLGGDFSGNILKIMPPKSTLIILGCLSTKPLALDSGTMIYHVKSAIPFFVLDWLSKIPEQEQVYWKKMVSDDLKSGGPIFGSEVSKMVQLEQWNDAFKECEAVATQGKILISME